MMNKVIVAILSDQPLDYNNPYSSVLSNKFLSPLVNTGRGGVPDNFIERL
jgi:hypothetical protein